jgi:hypothetical protein
MATFLETAKKRFQRCQAWEANARLHYDYDVKFANGDAYNMYQWPDTISSDRRASDRPCLTTNVVKQHNFSIINDAMQNKPGIKYRAVGDGASKEGADIWDGIARQIEYTSSFQSILDIATKSQVEGGVGYWRVVTEFENDKSFNQIIKFAPISDARAVYIDPDCQQLSCSDANFAFIFNDMLVEEFNRLYPGNEDAISNSTGLGESYGWVKKDHVRVAEYFYVEEHKDTLVLIEDQETGQSVTLLKSQIGQGAFRLLKADAATMTRPVVTRQVKWALIAGNKKIEENDWAGKYIPVVKIVGEEIVIDGLLDRKGHTRAMLDAQRMLNYWNSASVEFGALQTKTPWVVAKEAVDGFEDEWALANQENMAYLLWNSKAEDGTDIAKPERIAPPVQAMAYAQGAQQARAEMMMVSGQYENTMGQQGNERTGKAISERQRQGDRATYHFINNIGIGIRFSGEILKDLIPKIYDTKRVMQLLGEDGVETQVMLDPNAKQAWEKRKMAQEFSVEQIFNPNIGEYAVYADMGPGYATRREEAWNAFNNILTQSPQLVSVIGDLLLAAGDFPLSQEAAARLRRMVPPVALGEGPSQEVKEAQQQLEQAKGLVGQLTEENATLRIAAKGRDEANLLGAYKGETDRLKALGELAPIDPMALQLLVGQLVQEAMATALGKQVTAEAKREMLPDVSQGTAAHAAAAGSMPGQMNPLMAMARQGQPSMVPPQAAGPPQMGAMR